MKPPLPLAVAPAAPPAPTPTAAPAGPTPQPRAGGGGDKFPVVALCGSAGSLEALEAFFGALPERPGLALVVVTHLGATPYSQLPQVLQNFTPLPVAEATDGLRVRPDHVYVIPPDCDLSLLHGCLFVLRPTQPPGHRLPIDFFLESLAKDVGARAACIIFSGLGADGSAGLKAVMENFGLVVAQDPATAAFDAMPRAALATEFVDFALAPAQMPAELLAYAGRLQMPGGNRLPPPQKDPNAQPAHALQKIFLLIRQRTGHDFSLYKRNTIFRRIERRMNAHQIKGFAHYVRYLQENPSEVEQLFRELLIGVTRFFRDGAAFDSLQEHLQPLVLAKEPCSTVRVWAPGCSTGEEVYSLAMLLLECFDAAGPGRGLKLQLFATDIAPDAIDFARAGRYPAAVAADVSPARLARFFQQVDGHYQIRKEVRDVVVFALHDVNKDAPFTKLDLLCCRNLLIYLSAELQKSLLPVFHYALRPGGILFLGPSENLTGFQDLFQPLNGKWKISRRLETAAAPARLLNFPFAMSSWPSVVAHPAAMPPTAAHSGAPFADLVQKNLLAAYTPPAVVITPKGEILYVNGRTGKYLEPAPGVGGLNLFEMARDELRVEISGAVHRALQTKADVTVERVRVATAAGPQALRLSVRHLGAPEALAGLLLLVVFEDQPTPRRGRRAKDKDETPAADIRDAVLDQELQYTKRRLQTTVEEMEGSPE
ncbi:CheR family methyltransferase [Hymenobacter nivis]|uniref:protein-glutamate O-methyltransferase n=1 Tax=Hymenobacter nivis TaxID=1850093 RepID=A0A2Z3GRH5_9BACT|nr:CheR family methyltransferase [Hymenobacter nivis]AWM33655.1 chemotaxis protein CheB [Hymenobacter nivis]